ncbi:MAG: ribonuclease HI [Marinomonas sp.]|uniref:ribonuclease HI n=1 Tax=unclassified Marinomonas TaxID=196814 RepID=UPI0007AF8343|nr:MULTISPECIES: ribonuclease HI [unclassified Marinomonas]KZM38962.1 ribonuclease H [Marinomonas sp. SBI22]KZM39649.1 ribonuclease H [Marinomonas sp. SBI8L]
MKHVVIYTDGACKGNPGPGGWGAWITFGEHEKRLCGGENDTTNNRMELSGAIEGLKALTEACKVTLYTDSSYVQKGITQWLAGWKKKGWKTASKQPVKNKDLWQALDDECQRHDIEWKWVKGHAGIKGNEIADELANLGIEKIRD